MKGREVLPKLGALVCGDTIRWDSENGTTDENGHRALVVHQQWAERVSAQLQAVLELHTLDTDDVDLVPRCRECRKVHPCPTREAIR